MIRLSRPSPGVITSGFGKRTGGFHEGIDFGWGNGLNIYAAADGVVRHSGPGSIYGVRYGNLTIIDHGGFQTRYAHQSRMYVRPGLHVQARHLIGVKGGSGAAGPNTYPTHLHFELLIGGHRVDPAPYLGGFTGDDTVLFPEIQSEREYDMRIIRNKDDKNDETCRALLGEITFQRLTRRAADEEAILWGGSTAVDQHGWDRFEARVAARREELGLPVSAGDATPSIFTFTGTATPA